MDNESLTALGILVTALVGIGSYFSGRIVTQRQHDLELERSIRHEKFEAARALDIEVSRLYWHLEDVVISGVMNASVRLGCYLSDKDKEELEVATIALAGSAKDVNALRMTILNQLPGGSTEFDHMRLLHANRKHDDVTNFTKSCTTVKYLALKVTRDLAKPRPPAWWKSQLD